MTVTIPTSTDVNGDPTTSGTPLDPFGRDRDIHGQQVTSTPSVTR